MLKEPPKSIDGKSINGSTGSYETENEAIEQFEMFKKDGWKVPRGLNLIEDHTLV